MNINIGDRLRKEREKRGYSLEEVHSRLRIHPTVLASLESNNFEALPAAIYTKGFLRRYSDFLEVNSHELLSEYDSLKIAHKKQSLTIGFQEPKPAPPPAAPVQIPWREIATKAMAFRKPALYLLIGAVAFMTFSAVFNQILKPRPERPKAAAEAPTPKPAKSVKAEKQEKLEPKPEAPAVKPADDRTLINSPTLNNFPEIRNKEPLKLIITAATDAWIRVSADGQVVLESILKPGQRKELTAQKDFELKLGRPAGIQLALNGFALGSPGNGQAKHVVINHEGVSQLR